MSFAMNTNAITLSDKAASRISQIIADKGEALLLRISVIGSGCSGFSYQYDLVKGREEDDYLVTSNDASVVIDPISLEFLKGSTIDFVDDLIGQSFQIKNPNATSSCGCGVSFSV